MKELLRTESTFQQCIDYTDIAGHSSARICCTLTFVLARLSCNICHSYRYRCLSLYLEQFSALSNDFMFLIFYFPTSRGVHGGEVDASCVRFGSWGGENPPEIYIVIPYSYIIDKSFIAQSNHLLVLYKTLSRGCV